MYISFKNRESQQNTDGKLIHTLVGRATGEFSKVEGWMRKRGVPAVWAASSSDKRLGVGTEGDMGVGLIRSDMVVVAVVRKRGKYIFGWPHGHGTLLLDCFASTSCRFILVKRRHGWRRFLSRKSVSYAKVFNGGGCAPLVGEDAGDVGQGGGMPRAERARRGGNLSPEMKAACGEGLGCRFEQFMRAVPESFQAFT